MEWKSKSAYSNMYLNPRKNVARPKDFCPAYFTEFNMMFSL